MVYYYWGRGKFLVRGTDDAAATMAAAPVESCRFVVPRSLGSCLGLALDMGKRLPRGHGRSHR